MTAPLVLFPNRVAIGSAGGVPVYMTPEFSRALAALLEHVGGPSGASAGDVSVDLATVAAQGLVLQVAELQLHVMTLSAQIAALQAQPAPDLDAAAPASGNAAQLQALASRVDAAELERVAVPVASVDWGHPGAIGANTANTGKFTDLTASGKFGCNGKAAQPAVASGGTLTGVIAALISCGVLAS